jgi:hypothetical protein
MHTVDAKQASNRLSNRLSNFAFFFRVDAVINGSTAKT